MTTRKTFKPHEYQSAIIEHALNTERCAIWAGMGMGKTVSTLTVLDALELTEPGPALVLAPLRVASSTWPSEASKWEHLRNLTVSAIVGSAAERIAALRQPASVYTVNYDNLPWLIEQLRDKWPFTKVVADESTRLKSFRLRQGGKRAQALAGVAFKHAKRFIELTGTPSPNGLADLWGQIWFLDRGERLGRSYSAYMARWFQPVGQQEYRQYKPLPFAQEQIEDRLRDICLSLNAKDYFDLKEPIVNAIKVDLPSKARAAYVAMEKKLFLEIQNFEVEAFNQASKTIKCLQIANGTIYVDDRQNWVEIHDAKLQALESVINEAAGMPVLVAYHFKSDLARLKKAFPQGRELDKSPKTEADWNAGKIPVLFAHPASAGHGLNLQDGGNIVVFFGHWWDLELYLQIIERIGPTRQLQSGHNRPVFIHHIVARDTIDEDVMARRTSKREIQDILLESMKRRHQA